MIFSSDNQYFRRFFWNY